MTDQLSIGFLPLTDCAVLVAARERGFAAQQGLDLTLVRETTWASCRDRLVYRHVQAAQMLAPLALAVTMGLGVGTSPTNLVAPFKLNVNGNQIVVSPPLAEQMQLAPQTRITDPAAAAAALAVPLRARARAGRPAVFGVVHRYSCQSLILRYWLAAAGIDVDCDVRLRVIPPSFIVESLVAGEIDGFCAGEPWGSIAVDSGQAEVAALGVGIWKAGVEKVLALREDWANSNPDLVDRLVRALDQAAAWCDDPANHGELADLLARPAYLNQPAELLRRALEGRPLLAPARAQNATPEPASVPDMLYFHRGAANFPSRSQALWIYAQFVRWNMSPATPDAERTAAAVFRPDLYRRALGGVGTRNADAKLEGSLDAPMGVGTGPGTLVLPPDQFFDGRVFDPNDLQAYLDSFA